MEETKTVPDSAVYSYLETLLWSETLNCPLNEHDEPIPLKVPESSDLMTAGDTFEDGTPLDSIIDVSDLPPAIREEAVSELNDFASYCEDELGFDPFEVFDAGQVAHDFLLSRNRHGAGFFDGDYEHDGEAVSNDLQRAAKTFGTIGLMVWVEGGIIHIETHG